MKKPEQRQKALLTPGFQPLVEAAGGVGQVEAYCEEQAVGAAATSGTAPGNKKTTGRGNGNGKADGSGRGQGRGKAEGCGNGQGEGEADGAGNGQGGGPGNSDGSGRGCRRPRRRPGGVVGAE